MALEDHRAGGSDFADYVIGHRGRETGCDKTMTFDRRLKSSPLSGVLTPR